MACSVSRLDFKQRVCCLHFMWEATNAFFSIGTQFVIFEESFTLCFFPRRETVLRVSESSSPFHTGESFFSLLMLESGDVCHNLSSSVSQAFYGCWEHCRHMVLFLTLPCAPPLCVVFGMSCLHLGFDGICVSNRPLVG